MPPAWTAGQGGQPMIRILHAASGAALEVYQHGATVTSFTHRGQELFFLSSLAVFDGCKSLRGGNPIVFPQFAAQGALALHGFARVSPWQLLEAAEGCAVLRLTQADLAPAVAAQWPHAFVLTLRLTFEGPALRSQLTVDNPAPQQLHFEAMQHAYLLLGGARRLEGGAQLPPAAVLGLGEAPYLERVGAPAALPPASPGAPSAPLPLVGELERIYSGAGAGSVLVQGVVGPAYSGIRVAHSATVQRAGDGSGSGSGSVAQGLPSELLVFKPDAARAARIGGFAAREEETFVAVEPGCVTPGARVALAQGERFTLDALFSILE